MKKVFVLMICAWSVLVAGCNKGMATKAVKETKSHKVEFTSEQKKMIAELCDESNDNDIFIKDTFVDGHCYHI